MFVLLLRFLGVTPQRAGKTGSREAAWAMVFIAIGITVLAIWKGAEVVSACSPFLMVLWPAAIAALAGAYKLKSDRMQATGQ